MSKNKGWLGVMKKLDAELNELLTREGLKTVQQELHNFGFHFSLDLDNVVDVYCEIEWDNIMSRLRPWFYKHDSRNTPIVAEVTKNIDYHYYRVEYDYERTGSGKHLQVDIEFYKSNLSLTPPISLIFFFEGEELKLSLVLKPSKFSLVRNLFKKPTLSKAQKAKNNITLRKRVAQQNISREPLTDDQIELHARLSDSVTQNFDQSDPRSVQWLKWFKYYHGEQS